MLLSSYCYFALFWNNTSFDVPFSLRSVSCARPPFAFFLLHFSHPMYLFCLYAQGMKRPPLSPPPLLVLPQLPSSPVVTSPVGQTEDEHQTPEVGVIVKMQWGRRTARNG